MIKSWFLKLNVGLVEFRLSFTPVGMMDCLCRNFPIFLAMVLQVKSHQDIPSSIICWPLD